jgi:hypothetical protein
MMTPEPLGANGISRKRIRISKHADSGGGVSNRQLRVSPPLCLPPPAQQTPPNSLKQRSAIDRLKRTPWPWPAIKRMRRR